MLKTRVISAIIGLLLLIAIVLSGPIGFAIGVFLLSLTGIHEFYEAMSKGGYKPIRFVGYISCLSVLVVGLNKNFLSISSADALVWVSLGTFVLMASLLAFIIFKHEEYQVADIALTLFGIFYVVFLFAFMVMTRNLPQGIWFIWFIFIGAFATDTAAYFTGVNFGKRKILPAVSPKKSFEGMIGGILGCIIITVLYGVCLSSNGILEGVGIHHLIILGLLNGTLSQVGDWAASAIKRYVNIKDYGKIMPGHGGVLDRFDSILFVAPVVYFYFTMILL